MDPLFGFDLPDDEPSDECDHEWNIESETLTCTLCGCIQETALVVPKYQSDKEHEIMIDQTTNLMATVAERNKYIEFIRERCRGYRNESRAVGIPEQYFGKIADKVLLIQKRSSTHRSQLLINIIAACAKMVLNKEGIFIEENTIAKIFQTQKGLSNGRNLALQQLAAINMSLGINEISSVDTYVQFTNSVKMCCDRIKEYDQNVRYFITAMCTIANLFNQVETQVIITRFGGSYLYYRLAYTDATSAEEVIGYILKCAIETTPETIQKYYKKLLDTIPINHRIALRLGIGLGTDLDKISLKLKPGKK